MRTLSSELFVDPSLECFNFRAAITIRHVSPDIKIAKTEQKKYPPRVMSTHATNRAKFVCVAGRSTTICEASTIINSGTNVIANRASVLKQRGSWELEKKPLIPSVFA